MQIDSPLAEIHIKDTHFTYTVTAPAPEVDTFDEIWGKRTCIRKWLPVSPNASQRWFKHLDHLMGQNDVILWLLFKFNVLSVGITLVLVKLGLKNDCRGASSLSTSRTYGLTHYFEGVTKFTCVAGEIRRIAMSEQTPAATFFFVRT